MGVRSSAFSAVTGFSPLSPDVLKMSPNESFHVTDPYNLSSQSHNIMACPSSRRTNMTLQTSHCGVVQVSVMLYLAESKPNDGGQVFPSLADLVKFTFSLISTRFD